MLRNIVNHCLVLGLQWFQWVGAKGVGIVAVEVHIVGIIAHGTSYGIVASAIGAVGVREGVDTDTCAVKKTGDFLRGAVTAQQGVA